MALVYVERCDFVEEKVDECEIKPDRYFAVVKLFMLKTLKVVSTLFNVNFSGMFHSRDCEAKII